jgi:hypothetical protein
MSSWRRFASVVLLVLASGTLALPAAAAPAPHHVVSMAQARALPLGTVVTVDGTATTPSGAFESSRDDGFGLQDFTGGIYVSLPTNPHIAPRTLVRVTGTLTDSVGLLAVVPSDLSKVVTHGTWLPALPTPRLTGSVNESSEGKLVWVVATITQAPASDLPYGYKFFVNDGSGEVTIYVNTQTGITLSGLAAGQLVRVVGFSSQYDTHYEIDPRFPADILVLRR